MLRCASVSWVGDPRSWTREVFLSLPNLFERDIDAGYRRQGIERSEFYEWPPGQGALNVNGDLPDHCGAHSPRTERALSLSGQK